MSRPFPCLAAAVLTLALALPLAACGGGTTTPTTTPSTATPTPTASQSPAAVTPTPSASAAPAPAPAADPMIPADCASVGSQATHDEAVGDLNLQGDGTNFTRPTPDGATLALGCDWFVGDATGILLLVSTASTDAVTAEVGVIEGQGFSCQVSDDFGAQFCTQAGTSGLPNDETLVVARDTVWIYMETSNRNGRPLLSELATQIFG